MKYILPILIGISLSSCVSQKKYDALNDETNGLKQALNQKNTEFNKINESLDSLNVSYALLSSQNKTLQNDVERLTAERDYLQKQLADLNETFNALINANNGALDRKAKETKDLLDKLNKREQKLKSLESLIAAKDKQMSSLKNKLLSALKNYKGKGVEIYSKDGKIYISLDNSLLFPSGSWKLNTKALDAINQLSIVLASDKSLNVLIEGHTDNVPYKGNNVLNDNWDLSVKRSTSVVKQLLKNKELSPKRITAAGRSKYNPIENNSTKTGRAKNRRIEIIVLPDLSELEGILK